MPEHKALRSATVKLIENTSNIFNQPMVVCEDTDNGWMPLHDCSLAHDPDPDPFNGDEGADPAQLGE